MMDYPYGGANEIWRDGEGSPHNPVKSQIRDWGAAVEENITWALGEVDFEYGSVSSSVARENYEKLVSAINNGFGVINIHHDLRLDGNSALIVRGVKIKALNGSKITWTGTGAFTLDSGVFWEEENTNHFVEDVNFPYLLGNGEDIYIHHIELKNTKWDGAFYNLFTSANTLDPSENLFGFGCVDIHGIEIKNTVTSFWTSQSLPFKRFSVREILAEKFCRCLFSLPIENAHPYYDEIQAGMELTILEGVKVLNPESFFGDTGTPAFASFYHCVMLWEGDTIFYNDARVTGMKTTTDMPVYDLYMGGRYVNSDKTSVWDCWAFNRTTVLASEANTCVKIKKARRVGVDHRVWDYTEGFFDRMSSLYGLDSGSAYGEWVTYSGDAETGRYSITNSRLVLPHLNQGQIDTRYVQDLEYQGTAFICFGSGEANLMRVKWNADNEVKGRRCVMKGCSVIAPAANVSPLCEIDFGADDSADAIEITGNTIKASNISELKMASTGGFDISSGRIDHLALDNRVFYTGGYDKFVSGNGYPGIVNCLVSGDVQGEANTGDGLSLTVCPTGSGALTGRFKKASRSGNLAVELVSYVLPDASFVTTKEYSFTGKVIDVDGAEDFSVSWAVTTVVTSGTPSITLTYTPPGSSPASVSWSGSAGASLPMEVNTNHPTLAATIERSVDEMRIDLDLGGTARRYAVEFDLYVL